MFLVRVIPYAFRSHDLFHLRKQLQFLVIVVALHEAEPRLRVSDKLGLVFVGDVWSLEVYRVVATQDGVVDVRHMRSAEGEDVGLRSLVSLSFPTAVARGQHTFFVTYCGVGTRTQGPSAHGLSFVRAAEVMMAARLR